MTALLDALPWALVGIVGVAGAVVTARGTRQR